MDDLLQQGIAAYKAGKRDDARKIFITVVKQNPDSEKAWAWMYDVSSTNQERVHCLKQMLRINPNNKKASQRYKELTTASKPTSNSSRVALKPIIFISVALFCLVGIFFVGILFINTDKITSTPTSNALFTLATQQPPILQATVPPQSAVCSCSGDTLNCGDFSTHSQAQACYAYCVSLGRGDIHKLDGSDKDGLACESLP